jgi:hypothetical protein
MRAKISLVEQASTCNQLGKAASPVIAPVRAGCYNGFAKLKQLLMLTSAGTPLSQLV